MYVSMLHGLIGETGLKLVSFMYRFDDKRVHTNNEGELLIENHFWSQKKSAIRCEELIMVMLLFLRLSGLTNQFLFM